jgi:uncharacterized protein YwgA
MKLTINTEKIETLRPCQDRFDNWKKNFVSIGKKHGYSNAEIRATIAIIKSVLGSRK